MSKQRTAGTTSRRGFFKTAAASSGAGRLLAGAASAAPVLLGAADKAGTRRPVLGSGEYQYEAYHDWGELPANIKYGNTHGVCEDSQARIYVHHTVNAASESSDTMVVFDHQGKFVRSWGKEFKGGAHGLHIHKEGSEEFLYLCDMQHDIVTKTTLKGEIVYTLGYPKESEQYKADAAGNAALGADGKPLVPYRPTNLATAPNGDLYVGDGYGSSFINQYSKKGEFIRTFGGKGSAPGQVNCPHGITMDMRGAEPRLLVADRSNNRLQYFTLDGQHIEFVGGVNLPCHFGERHGVMVIPDLAARVTLLDRNNQVIEHLGQGADNWRDLRKEPRDHFIPGKFICPHGACFDHVGNIIVVEWVEVGRVTKLRKV